MATLNYEWQELGRVTFYTSGSVSDTVSIEGILVSQSIENNTSTIGLRFKNLGAKWRTTNGTVAFTGTYTDSGSCATYPDYVNTNDVFYSIQKTVSHSSNGTKSITVGGTISAYVNGAQRSGTISQVSVVLPTIARGSTWNSSLLTISDINGTFKFPITKYSSSFYDTVTVFTTINNATITTFSGVSSSQSYSFTSTEKTNIFNNTTSQYPIELTLTLTTYTSNGGTQIGTSTIPCKAYIVNGEPTISIAITEQDTNVKAFFGGDTSATNIIKNASDLLFTITVTPKNSATVKSVTVNGASATLSSGTTYTYRLNNITTGTFNIVATDSRTLQGTSSTTRNLINYTACKINSWSVKRLSATSSTIQLSANLTCNGSKDLINENDNIKYVRYKVGSNGTWRNVSFTLGTTITITNFTLTDTVEYTEQQTIYFQFKDSITTASDNKVLSKGVETFSYSDTDFQINGDLFVGDTTGSNLIDMTHQYSTSEKKVGYWINGKPLYRKVLNFGALPNATSRSVAHGISNYDEVITLKGTARASTYRFPIPQVTGTTSQGTLAISLGSTNVTIRTTTDMSSYSTYVIIEYTKTTDTATS